MEKDHILEAWLRVRSKKFCIDQEESVTNATMRHVSKIPKKRSPMTLELKRHKTNCINFLLRYLNVAIIQREELLDCSDKTKIMTDPINIRGPELQNLLAYKGSNFTSKTSKTSHGSPPLTRDEKRLLRAEHGYCLECEGPPVLLYHVKSSWGLVRRKPRSAVGECEGGVCYICYPNSDPTFSPFDDTIAQDLSESGVATVLSIDQWTATEESKCECKKDPTLGVNFICMHPNETRPTTKTPNKAEAARYQEIFIDLVGMLYAVKDAGSRHVLDDRFDSFLSPGEKAFKDSLFRFLQGQSKEARSTHAFSYLEKTLRDKMGYRNVFGWSNRIASSITSAYFGLENGILPTQPSRTSVRGQHSTSSCVNDSPGHVFVCNASVCDIQCDAFLCPGDISLKTNTVTGSICHQWHIRSRKSKATQNGGSKWHGTSELLTHDGFDRVVTLRDWPEDATFPLMVAGEVSLESQMKQFQNGRLASDLSSEEMRVEFLLETLRQFLKLATKLVRRRKPFVMRERYLLAVPVLGTGGGYAGDMTGQIVDGLLTRLNEFVATRGDIDVVLVTADDATYAHAQVIRNQGFLSGARRGASTGYGPHQYPCFRLLSGSQQHYAAQLAAMASHRHLALFVGAGVSIGSGLPSWFGLLHIIEDAFTATGDPSERSIGDTTKWDPVLMAEELDSICKKADRNGVLTPLKQRVCEYLADNGHNPGLLLSLLMSLPFHSIVTQNYDNLIEKACERWNVALRYSPKDASNTKRNLSVIPYRPRRNAQYWLLKMHGCISVPNDIILTKADYDSYPNSSRSQALDGLVQASLLTKHLLFVGFSLTDPNYLRIIDQVRDALYFDTSNDASHDSSSNRSRP